MTRAYSIRIFLPDGTADGLRIVEKSNWSGRGIVCPRAIFPDSKSRDEFARTGVYVLVGPSDSGDLPTLYIGEGDTVRKRLESHYANKDFWTSAVFFVSKDDHLNKAHVQYIESRLIMLATEAKKAKLDNSVAPVLPSMSEMDVADAEGFLDEMLLCFPIVGINEFTKPQRQVGTDQLYLNGSGAEATGYEAADGFVVLAGGSARIAETETMPTYIRALRDQLVENGVLVIDGDTYCLTQDYTFNSPSMAAAVMMARNANGRVEWKDSVGRTLKELQETSVGMDE